MTSAPRNRPVPRPPGHVPLIGHAAAFDPQPLEFCRRWQRELGDLVRFRIVTNEWYLMSDPKHVHRVLVSEASTFRKPGLVKRLWKPFLGEGLLGTDGELWKRHHKLVLPGFHKKRVDEYGSVMVRATERMLSGWRSGGRRDVCNDFTELTLAIVAKTLFDANVDETAGRVGRAMDVINQVMVDHIKLPIDMPRWWPTRANRRKVAALDDFRGIVRGILDERRRSGEDRGDLLSMLILSKDDAGRTMTDAEVHDEAMTLFFAGHETTSIALTYMWYLLARHRDVEEKLHEEIVSVVGTRPLTVADLPSLPYLEMVVKESLRILPPVWSFMRSPVEDFAVDDHVIPKDSVVFISPYVLHHDARWFPEPEQFRPERFSKDAEKTIVPGSYVPFAAGPRVCLGKTFAMMEARLILGTLVQRCRMRIPEDYELVFHPRLSLRPKAGMPADPEFREPVAPTAPLATNAA